MILLAALLMSVEPTPSEASLLQKLGQKQYIVARDEAQKLLAANPDSIVAHWTLAIVHDEAEGNYARCLYHLQRVEELSQDKDPMWHNKAMLQEASVLRDMNRNAEALEMLDRHDRLYPQAPPVGRIWALFKEDRNEEGLAIAKAATTSEDWWTRLSAYNGLVSYSAQAYDRNASYDWMKRGIEATQGKSCILFRNGSGSAYSMFRFQEAEELGLKAAKAEEDDCAGSRAYDQLAGLYLLEGEYQKALSALKSLNSEPMLPRWRPQFALTGRAILALILHVFGKVEDAERLTGELYAMPQRVGMSSGSDEDETMVRAFRYMEALDARLELLREQRSYRSFWTMPSLLPMRLALTRWQLQRTLLRLLTRGDTLLAATRPNLGSPYEWPAWTTADLIAIVGSGVMAKTVSEARRSDAGFPQAAGYFDALAGEIAFRENDLTQATFLASEALRALNHEEALLRWRTIAWQAEALKRLGRMPEAATAYQEVLEKFPSVLRMLTLEVPVKIGNDGSAPARIAADRLSGSRRFEVRDDAPFRLETSSQGDKVHVCLSNASGMQISCAGGDNVQAALDAFHATCFSPRVALSQIDLNSLDGSPGRQSADDALKAVLPP